MKTCFESLVGIWSARMGKKCRFLLAFFGFFGIDLIAHNPEGSEGSAAGGRNTWGSRKACFAGKGEAKTQVEFSACGKCNIVACALTKRVAAVDKIEEKRKPEDFIGHRNRA